MGVMTPFKDVLNPEQIKDVANYVRSLSGLSHDAQRAQRGAQVFAENCAVCHGPDAKGNPRHRGARTSPTTFGCGVRPKPRSSPT